MKKIFFLGLILLNLQIIYITPKTKLEAELQDRPIRLNRAIKKGNLSNFIEFIKSIKLENGSMDIFKDPKLLEKASKKFKNKKTCANDSGIIEDLLYAFVPISFIAPYIVFYYIHKDTPFNTYNYRIRRHLETTGAASLAFGILSLLFSLITYDHKMNACKQSKLIYKILKRYSSTSQSGDLNV